MFFETDQVLRQHLVQEVEDLIQQQRLNFLVEGTKFPRYKRSGDILKGQYRYVKLHTNHKVTVNLHIFLFKNKEDTSLWTILGIRDILVRIRTSG